MIPSALHSLPAVLVAVGCSVLGACGGEDEAPVSASDVVGTYVLDKEATLAALLEAVAAMANDANRESDSALAAWQRKLPVRAAMIERGDLDITLMLRHDRTYEAERTVDGHYLPSHGTYERSGNDLLLRRPNGSRAERRRIHEGLLESLDPYGHTYEVLRRMPDDAIHEGLLVDILFDSPGTQFGDLFTICGEPHAAFPPTGSHSFDDVADLGFTQVDDYFGIRRRTEEGDEVAVWLYPLVNGEAVYHHPGPFDGIRLDYSVLRNPDRRVALFLRAVKEFAAVGGVVGVRYVTRSVDLGVPPDLGPLKQDIRAVISHWRSQGIEVGSDDALLVD